MKRSIKQEIALVFIAVMTGTIVLCWIINSSFLENYYIENKKMAINAAYLRINEVVENGSITSEDFDIDLIDNTHVNIIMKILILSYVKHVICIISVYW